MSRSRRPKTYRCVEIVVPAKDGEVLSEVLWEMDSLGVEELESGDSLHCIAYFDPVRPVEALLQEVKRRLGEGPGIKVTAQSIAYDEQVWVDRFAAQFRAFEVSPTVYVHPPWDRPSARHRVNILLEPGHGFGTGTHESTQLALTALEEALASSQTFADVGTGSGILSVAAAQLRPGLRITSFDIDPLAVEEAKENFQRNEVGNFGLFAGEIISLRAVFDVVAANLTAPILGELAGELCRITGKFLVASGFTMDEAEYVRHRFWRTGNFSVNNAWSSNDWSCFLFHRCTES